MDDKKTHILKAAMRVVIAYGFKRVSMADIAQEAGISRPAIYQIFRNKDDVFFSCMDMLVAEAFAAADAAIDGVRGEKARASAYLLAYMGYFHALLVAGPHGQELLDANNRLGAEKSQAAQARFVAALNGLMGLAADAEDGQVLALAAMGIKYHTDDPAQFRARLTMLTDRFL